MTIKYYFTVQASGNFVTNTKSIDDTRERIPVAANINFDNRECTKTEHDNWSAKKRQLNNSPQFPGTTIYFAIYPIGGPLTINSDPRQKIQFNRTAFRDIITPAGTELVKLQVLQANGRDIDTTFNNTVDILTGKPHNQILRIAFINGEYTLRFPLDEPHMSKISFLEGNNSFNLINSLEWQVIATQPYIIEEFKS